MSPKILSHTLTLILLVQFGAASAQDTGGTGDSAYQDLSHYSSVFGHDKLYRLYLPKGYTGSTHRYPVIYFFHGWGGRHFKDDNAKLEYARIKALVDKYQSILVMWDGNIDLSEPRPYNVGNHEDVKFQVQMKDYFPELVAHIDSTYRTLPDRTHRGIIGFSMGGFMSLFLAGKYPDRVCAAVSMAGSPEFFVGYPDNQELYPVRYTFINLRQVDTRIHNGNTDILYYLNSEVHAGALWDEKVNLQYWPFKGGHRVDLPGETKVFESAMKFITESFRKRSLEAAATSNPANWSHYDLYPSFGVWDYKVISNKREPGFLFLKNADKAGFGFYTYRWLPTGPSLPDLHATITTAPLYGRSETYNLIKYNRSTGVLTPDTVGSDEEGRLMIECSGAGEEIGISEPGDPPEFVFLDYSLRGPRHYLPVGEKEELRVRLFNRGGENRLPVEIRVRIGTKEPSVKFADTIVNVKVYPGRRTVELPPFVLSCFKRPPPHAEPADIRFHLTVRPADGSVPAAHSTEDEFTAPVFFQAPVFDSVRIDDGIRIRDTAMGSGNGNGVAEAGERILLYQGTHRLRLYTEDPWVLPEKERLADEMIPGRWPDGFTLSSVAELSPDCPDGHVVEFLASYETKTYNPIERKRTWGRVKLRVHHPVIARSSTLMDDFFGVNVGNCEAAPADVQAVAGWIRDYSQWKWLQPEKDSYRFADALGKMNYDAYYRKLDSLHIHSLFVVQQTPSWISQNGNASDAHTYAPSGKADGLKPEDYSEAASFFYQLAARYGQRRLPEASLLTKDRLTGLGLMRAIEVYNEPDGTWGNHMSLQQYAALLNAAYDGNGGKLKGAFGIKTADPDMLVSIGGLADNLGSLKKIVAYAGRAPFDIINAHYYTFQNVREGFRVSVAPEWSSLVPDMKEMVAWGRIHAPGRPVWLTEIGWDTKNHSTEFVSEQEAANYLIRSYLLALGTGIDKCFWFIFSDIDDVEKPGVFTSSGLFENASTPWTGPTRLKPKLTYWYNATCKHLLSGYYYDKNLSFPGGDSTLYHYRFTTADGKRQLSVCWYCPKFQFAFRPLSGQPSHVDYRYTPAGGNWKITKIVKPVAGSIEGSPVDYHYGNEDDRSDKGTIVLPLDGTPVFVEIQRE